MILANSNIATYRQIDLPCKHVNNMQCSLYSSGHITRVGQNRINTPYMAVLLVISCQKHRIHTVYIWFWPTLHITKHRSVLNPGKRACCCFFECPYVGPAQRLPPNPCRGHASGCRHRLKRLCYDRSVPICRGQVHPQVVQRHHSF
jgi:hypothetical protein